MDAEILLYLFGQILQLPRLCFETMLCQQNKEPRARVEPTGHLAQYNVGFDTIRSNNAHVHTLFRGAVRVYTIFNLCPPS